MIKTTKLNEIKSDQMKSSTSPRSHSLVVKSLFENNCAGSDTRDFVH